MKYIHEICLKKWIEVNCKGKKEIACEICKHLFSIETKYKYLYEKEKIIQMLKSYILTLFTTCVLAGAMLALVYYIFDSVFMLEGGGKLKLIFVLALTGFTILFIVNWGFCYKCREKFFTKELKSWKIHNWEKDFHPEHTK